jgi:hypothetical protein
MPRIQLAYWHGSHAPGDEVDVTDEELHALRRDGRVAAVVENSAPAPQPAPPAPAESVAEPETPAPEGRARKGR